MFYSAFNPKDKYGEAPAGPDVRKRVKSSAVWVQEVTVLTEMEGRHAWSWSTTPPQRRSIDQNGEEDIDVPTCGGENIRGI